MRFSLKYATNKQTEFYKTLVSCSGWNEYCCSNKSIGFSFDLFELALKTTPIKNPCFNTTRWYGVMWLLQCGVVWFGSVWRDVCVSFHYSFKRCIISVWTPTSCMFFQSKLNCSLNRFGAEPKRAWIPSDLYSQCTIIPWFWNNEIKNCKMSKRETKMEMCAYYILLSIKSYWSNKWISTSPFFRLILVKRKPSPVDLIVLVLSRIEWCSLNYFDARDSSKDVLISLAVSTLHSTTTTTH